MCMNTIQELILTAKTQIIKHNKEIKKIINQYRKACDKYNDEFNDYDTYEDSDVLWDFHSKMKDYLYAIEVPPVIITVIREHGDFFGSSDCFTYDTLLNDVKTIDTIDVEDELAVNPDSYKNNNVVKSTQTKTEPQITITPSMKKDFRNRVVEYFITLFNSDRYRDIAKTSRVHRNKNLTIFDLINDPKTFSNCDIFHLYTQAPARAGYASLLLPIPKEFSASDFDSRIIDNIKHIAETVTDTSFTKIDKVGFETTLLAGYYNYLEISFDFYV